MILIGSDMSKSPSSGYENVLMFCVRFFLCGRCLCAPRSLAEYTQILAKLLQEDMIKFMVVFFIFLVTFCGSFLLALRGHVTSVSGSNGTNLTMSDLDTTNNAMYVLHINLFFCLIFCSFSPASQHRHPAKNIFSLKYSSLCA